MTVINTNVGALLARTYAAKANETMTTSMERLSSGQRINSAADDAAGLAVANKMKSQLRGINMAMRNSKDGISLVETAEAGMGEITNMILRMRELAVQMDNGIYTSGDRDNAQREINALLAEMDKIAANTRFNDVALLDGTYDQTIRAGNTNAETVRINLDSLFAKDNGSQAKADEPWNYRRSIEYKQYTDADYTYNLSDLASLQLGITASAYDTLGATDSEAVLTDVVSSSNIPSHNDNMLLLKDDVAGLGYTYAALQIADEQWEKISSNLLTSRGLLEELSNLEPSQVERKSQITSRLEQLEIERSRYIGSQFSLGEIKEQSVFVGEGLSNGKYAEVLNIYSDPETRENIAGQIAAIEIDFKVLAENLRPAAIAKLSGNSSSGVGTGSGASFASRTEGFNDNGDEYAAALATHTTSGSGAASVASPSSNAVSPLVKGSKWDTVGDDSSGAGGANNLSYSFWDGSSPYNYTQGTRATVESKGTGNTAAHRTIFERWDAISPFSLDEVTEDGDGDPVGDLRVAFTDDMPSGAAAFAYYPNSGATGGDIYYGDSVNITGVDFVDGNYNWSTALHEIGHALGLSHPFDGGAKDGSTLNLNLDFERNTVMTYIQRDRNTVISWDGTTASYQNIYASTPGLLDVEAIEHIYGSTNWSNENGDTTYGTTNDNGFNDFDNNYDSIRTITDSGGTDTLDASNVTATGSIINLTPGTYSSIAYYATQADKIAAVTGGNAGATTYFTNLLTSLDSLASAGNEFYSSYDREALYRGQDNVGIAHNTWIEHAKGGAGADTITGNNKANEITGNGGNDTIDGSGGDDIAIYSGNKASYTVSAAGSGYTVSGGDGTDTVTNIEYLAFDDGVWDITSLGGAAAFANLTAARGSGLTSNETGGQTGGVAFGEGGTNVGGLTLANIQVETANDARNAVTVLNTSLEQISSARAKLGAVMNRLSHNIDNQSKASMMSEQARGRIVDSDMAIESTKLAQQMILSQAAQQAINMATRRQETVLQLLGSMA